MPEIFCNSFETPLLPGSFLKFWDLGALGNCLTRLREGPALLNVIQVCVCLVVEIRSSCAFRNGFLSLIMGV